MNYIFFPENQLNSFHNQLLHRSKILIDDQLQKIILTPPSSSFSHTKSLLYKLGT